MSWRKGQLRCHGELLCDWLVASGPPEVQTPMMVASDLQHEPLGYILGVEKPHAPIITAGTFPGPPQNDSVGGGDQHGGSRKASIIRLEFSSYPPHCVADFLWYPFIINSGVYK